MSVKTEGIIIMSNPFSMVFGKAPEQLISRTLTEKTLLDDLNSENPPYQTYLITGVRGSGKTVMMTDISNKLKKQDGWIVVELNPDRDLIAGFAAYLASNNKYSQLFKAASINLSFLGLGVELSGVAPITDVELALREMLTSLNKQGKKILVTIDEVTNNKNIRAFASAFQILVRNDLPVFLLMTGLYENINAVQDEKNLTFLYRAPKLEMNALNIGAVTEKYKDIFDIDHDKAHKMAILTKGYPFAFQVLGYLTWNNGGDYTGVINAYRQHLEEFVYEKIWTEMSSKDKSIAYAIASCPSKKIKDIRDVLAIETNEFNPYRKRLIKRGIIDGSEYGSVKFVLPMFEDFVLDNY